MWTLPKDATLEVLPEYRGIGDNDQQYLDTRITIVLQDRTNSFWAMVASLETADARLFRDELEKAIPQRIKALEGLGKNAGDAQVAAPRFASSDQASKFGEINPKLPLRPTVSGRSLSKPIMISLTSIPPGTPIKSDLKMELTLGAASSLASNITNELGWRDVAKAIEAAGKPASSGPVQGREIITDHFLFPSSGIPANEFGVLILPPRARFTITADEPTVNPAGNRGVDSRTVITLADEANKIALISRIPTADAMTLGIQIRKLAAQERAAGALPGNGDSDIVVVVASQIYKQDNASMVHLAGASLIILPGYSGISRNNERITDDRITLVINDSANSFWPLVARLDLALAEKLAADIARASQSPAAPAPR